MRNSLQSLQKPVHMACITCGFGKLDLENYEPELKDKISSRALLLFTVLNMQ